MNLDRIIEINKECFTSDDKYSDPKFVQGLLDVGAEVITVRLRGETVGYIIFQELGTHIESLRRALTKKARGKGLGLRLTRKLVAIANRRRKDIYTYVAKTNLASLNSNLKCGYRVENIDEDWVYIRHKYQ